MEHTIFTLLVFTCIGSALNYYDSNFKLSKDRRLLAQIGQAIWNNKEQFLMQLEGDLPEDGLDVIWDLISEESETDPETLDISCLQCRSLIGGLRGFINQGLEFADIRDLAVDVCYNVTVSLGWNGEIMCEGIIDVFGPHVYWILNQTDKEPREICEFHFTCPTEETNVTRNKKPIRHKVTNDITPERKEREKYKKQIIKVAHLTDAHLDEKYTPGGPTDCPGLPVCCRDYLPGTGEANEWGEVGCALSVPTLHVILRFIAQQGVDLVINTGDTPNHALWEETQEGQLRQSEILADGIREFIPGVPAHLSLGNHDTYPTNQFYGPSPYIQDLLHHVRTMYQDLANFTEEQAETFEHGGYYTTLLIPGLRLMVYNSEYSYTDNYYGVLLEDTPDWVNMTRFMEDTFDIARANGERILLVSHHPMGIGFTFWHDFINDIMYRNGDLVMLHLFGHRHLELYKMGLDENGDAFHVNLVTTSLFSERNPAFKIISIDTDTLIPVGFETYFLNLSRPIDEGSEPEIELMYSSSTDYGMSDLSPAAFQEFTDRMEADDDLFQQFRWNELTRHHEPPPCTEECKQEFFCQLRTVSRYDYEDCISQ